MSAMVPYDEMSMFHENAEEFGIPYDGPPQVERVAVEVTPGRHLSALVWGDTSPELVLLHGGAQNAHTWDTVALALDRPLVAIDLPGHGHSDAGRNGSFDLINNADDLAAVIGRLAPNAAAVVGMSLGGLTTLALVDTHPELVRRVGLVDVTPGVTSGKAEAITAFVNGPETFPSFDEILARTIEFNPTRSVSSLRRGILHNALQRPDGSWVWRYRRFDEDRSAGRGELLDGGLWGAVARIEVPLLLVRGMRPGSVVDDADEAELLRQQPGARVIHVNDAGHSVQGDDPLALAAILTDFLAA
jgi:pimeloyl-ACP methyl ester carboxylesterase